MKTPISLSISPGADPAGVLFGGRSGWHYKVPGTNVTLHSTGMGAMYQKLWMALVGNKGDISEGWMERLHDGICEQMPYIPCREIYTHENNPVMVEGRARWKELHEFASSYPDQPTDEDRALATGWLADWRNRIPTYGCKCRQKFALIEEAKPVDLSSRDAFYQWSCQVHDMVNEKLGKPKWHQETSPQPLV
jgi:hypothetical protein